MKGSYHRSSNKVHLKRILIIGVVLIVVLLLGRSLFIGGASTLNNSVFRTTTWFGELADVLPRYLQEEAELIATIEELESRLTKHSADQQTINTLLAENRELRRQLGATTSTRTLATVIGRPPQLPYDAILIDKGSTDAVETGAIVYHGNDRAIGVVIDVYPQSALVALVTSPGIESSVFVLGPNIYTTAEGQGGGILQVNVPQGVPLSMGDLVVVPALGSGIYGEIVEIVSVPTEPVQYGYVTTKIPMQHIRAVTVGEAVPEPISFAEAAAAVEEARLEQLVVDIPDAELVDVSATSATSTATTTPFE